MKPTAIKIASITRDASIQPRAAMRPEVIEDYAERMNAGELFPPVEVFRDGAELVLADGWHRVAAAESIGAIKLDALVFDGGREAALLHALKANQSHGLRRSNDDKRRCVQLALTKWPDQSSREIAELCGVCHTFVDGMRPQLATVASSTRTGKDGKKRKLPTKETPPPSPTCRVCGATDSVFGLTDGVCHQCVQAEQDSSDIARELAGPPHIQTADEEQKMVFCNSCRAKIPEKDAESSSGMHYCDWECRKTWEESHPLDSSSPATSAVAPTGSQTSDSPDGNSSAPAARDLEPECKREITIQIQASLNQAHEYGPRGIAHWILEVERFAKIAMKWRDQ